MSRAATSRLKVNPPLGTRPTLEWCRLTDLTIDASYQRSIQVESSQTLIRRIAAFWDWSLCQPLAIARRLDVLKVVDGQHRLEAARLRGDIDQLPCVITQYANAGEEAAAFVALNQCRRPLTALDLFKAAVVAEDTVALLILDCVTSAGLALAPHMNNKAWKPGQIANIGGLRECLRGKGERVLRDALLVLGHAYNGQVLRYAGTIFPGIAHIVANEQQGLTDGEIGAQEAEFMPGMIDMVAAGTQKEWADEIVKLAPEHSRGRRGAAWQVFEKAWGEFLEAYFEEDEIAA